MIPYLAKHLPMHLCGKLKLMLIPCPVPHAMLEIERKSETGRSRGREREREPHLLNMSAASSLALLRSRLTASQGLARDHGSTQTPLDMVGRRWGVGSKGAGKCPRPVHTTTSLAGPEASYGHSNTRSPPILVARPGSRF